MTKLCNALILSTLLLASQVVFGEPEQTPWYNVEVIVFSQQDMFNDEAPRTDIQLSYPNKNWLRLSTLGSNSSYPRNDISGESPYQLLSKESHQLGPVHYTLRRAPGYRILHHAAWRQPGLDTKNTPWVIIQGGEQQSDGHYELEGSVRIVKTRFLHAQADLWKTRFKPVGQLTETVWPELPAQPSIATEELEETRLISSIDGSQPSVIDGTLTMEENLTQQNNILDIVTLKQSLKLSVDELSYLDHPAMGMLVLVSRYKPEPPSSPPTAPPVLEPPLTEGQPIANSTGDLLR